MFSIKPTQILMKNIFQNALMVWVGNTHLICNKLNQPSFLHNIVRSLRRNLDDFQVHLLDEHQYRFNVIRVTETKTTEIIHAFCLNMSRHLLLDSGGVSPCQQRLSFSCWSLAYLRKTLLESSEIFVEHTRQVARIWFRIQSCACDSGLGYVHRIINKWMLALEKNSFTRENKID